MKYETVFLNTFLKRFKKLPENVKERLRKRVLELAIDPHIGLRLVGDLAEFWKDRVGDYRILYKIEESSHKIIFYDVDLRKRIYD